jgi:hypothetical protein
VTGAQMKLRDYSPALTAGAGSSNFNSLYGTTTNRSPPRANGAINVNSRAVVQCVRVFMA